MDDAPSACVAHVNSIGEGKNVFRFDQTRPAPEKQKKTRNIRGNKNNNNGNERKWPNAIDKPTHTQTKFKKIDTHRESHHDEWHNPPGPNSYFV